VRQVFAIGGNALLKRGEVLSAENQRGNMAQSARTLAKVMQGHEVVLVHGNGPQVGLLALEGEAFKDAPAYPLDILGAESQGMIGYLIEQELHNVMPDQRMATLITQTLVDANDPAFGTPTKPIGPVYERPEAEKMVAERGWTIAADGQYFRRVVPSPRPIDVLGLQTIEELVTTGVLVICTGGGGVPVLAGEGGQVSGVEAVIDKDLAASLLARRLNADVLVIDLSP
jgi:carbamate kinase